MGTTSIIKEVHPPVLSWWASRLALLPLGRMHHKTDDDIPVPQDIRLKFATEHLEKLSKLSPEEYFALLEDAYRAHDQRKTIEGEKGKIAHKDVEDYIRKCIAENEGHPLPAEGSAKQFSEWALQDVDKFIFTEGHCYSEKIWVGGIIDYGFLSKDGRFILGDRKTSKSIYPSQFYQLGGYGLQLSENGVYTPEGERIFMPVQVQGFVVFQQKGESDARVLYRDDVEFLEKIFIHDVDVYKDAKNIGKEIINLKK